MILKLSDCYLGFLNMDHRTDRLEHIQKQFSRFGLIAERTRGKKPSEFDLSNPSLQPMVKRTPGALGCWFGQVEIMQKALAQGKHAWVNEDDVIFCEDLLKRFEYIEKWSQTHDWDIFWLGGTYHLPAWWHTGNNSDLPGAYLGRDAEVTDDPRIIRSYGIFSTHSYVVNNNSIEKILKLLQRVLPESYGIDHAMIHFEPEILSYAFAPGMAVQLDNLSDIGNGMTIFSGFKSLGAHWYAEKMEDFSPETYDWKDAKIL